MKKILFFLPLLVLALSCVPPEEETSEYEPIFMKRAVMEASIKLDAARPLVRPGKIYTRDNLLIINEQYSGVHIIDNSDPSNPVAKHFLTVPGCIDMALKQQVLYLDNSVDLVAFDLTKMQLVKRIRNVFPEPLPPDLNFMPELYSQGARPESDMVLVAWELRK